MGNVSAFGSGLVFLSAAAASLALTACEFQKTEVVRPPLPPFTPRPPTTVQVAEGARELKRVSYISQAGVNDNEAMAVVGGSRVYLRGPSGSNGSGVLWFERPAGSAVPMDPSPIPMVNPGGDDDPTYLTSAGTNLFFRGRTATGKYTVYSYGGTSSPKPLPPVSSMGGNNDDPRSLTAWGTRLCYSAFDGSNQRLFCTQDSGACWTNTGPIPSPTPSTSPSAPCLSQAPAIGDSVSPNLGPFYPSALSAGIDQLFFIGYIGGEYRAYRYDGTSLSAQALPRPSVDGDTYTYPDWIGAAGSDAYFSATSSIDNRKRIYRWRSDLDQVERLPNSPTASSYPQNLTMVGNDLYFSDYSGSGYQHVFKYNPTDGLVEFVTGNSSGYSYPSNVRAWRGSFYFFDYDDAYIMRLNRIDASATAVAHVSGPTLPDVPNWPGEIKGGQTKLYFGAYNTNPARNQSQLFYSDSTYVYPVNPVVERWDYGSPHGITPFNSDDTLFFNRVSLNGVQTDQLYYYNGTLLRQLSLKTDGGNDQIGKIVVSTNDHDMFFTAYNQVNGYDAFHYDGQNLYPLTRSDGGAIGQVGYSAIGASGSKAYFVAMDQRSGSYYLYVYPGTGDPHPVPLPSSGPSALTVTPWDTKIQEYGGSVYFSGYDSMGWNLFKLDTVTNIATPLTTTPTGYVSDLRKVGNKLYISANWGGSNYVYDGSVLSLITGVYWTNAQADGPGDLFYLAAYGPLGQRLYQMTGGVASQLSNINATGDSVNSIAVTSGGLVVFDAYDANASIAGNYLWVYDPASTDPVRLPSTGNGAGGAPDSPSGLVAVGTHVYFKSLNVDGRTRLFVTDGVTVQKICSINTSGDDNPGQVTAVGDDIFFTAVNSSNTNKVYIYSPLKPTLGCRTTAESNPGGDDAPYNLTAMNGHAYFIGQYGGTQYFRALFRY